MPRFPWVTVCLVMLVVWSLSLSYRVFKFRTSEVALAKSLQPARPSRSRNGASILVAVATCNMFHLTADALNNLNSLSDDIDILVIDDSSEDKTALRVKARGYQVLSSNTPIGVTANWNRAYAYWKHRPQYEALYIVNNDVVFPDGAFTRMTRDLASLSRPAIIGPMSTKHGVGVNAVSKAKSKTLRLNQTVEFRHDPPAQLLSNLPAAVESIQSFVQSSGMPTTPVETTWILGYVLGMNRRIVEAEIPGMEDTIFDPANQMLRQEDDLFYRRHIPAFISRSVFVFHHKGGTLGTAKDKHRDRKAACHEPKDSSVRWSVRGNSIVGTTPR